MTIDPFEFIDENSKDECDFPILSLEQCVQRLQNKTEAVFFTGAGFSKAWKSSYPLGFDLFSIDDIEKLKSQYNFVSLADAVSIHTPEPGDVDYTQRCYDYFCELKFHLDIFKRYPSLMPDDLDETMILEFENEIRTFIFERFKSMVDKTELDLDDESDFNNEIAKLFFDFSEKIKNLTFISTNYDFIIEKIFHNKGIKSINRGIVNREHFQSKCWGVSNISLFKINGGFEVFNDGNGFYLNYKEENKCPNVILPSKDQNYDNKYYKNMFIKSASRLREASVLVFIGYSLPIEDHTIRFLLKNFVDCKGKEKEIYIIDKDLKSATIVSEKVGQLFPNILENDAIYAVDGSLNDMSNYI